MYRYLFAVSLLIVPFPRAIAQTLDLETLLWTHRPLLIFTPSAAIGAKDLRAAIRHAEAEFRDRDMVRIEVYEDARPMVDGRELAESVGRELRQRYGVAEGKTMLILIGKDGGEKLRTNDIANLEQVFVLIDSMPMRRNEMRQRNSPDTATQNIGEQ